ncbi:unnamed protein product [Coccothraustes coccothraustes]
MQMRYGGGLASQRVRCWQGPPRAMPRGTAVLWRRHGVTGERCRDLEEERCPAAAVRGERARAVYRGATATR